MPANRLRVRFQPRVESCEDRLVPAAWTPIADGTVAVAPEDGGAPKIHLVEPVTGKVVKQVIGYEGSFRGGIHAELGDVTGDGIQDLVFAPGGGGGPRVKVVDGSTGEEIADFLAYEDSFRGGIDIAVGDVNNDGFEDVVTGTGDSGGPRVQVFDGKSIADGATEPTVLYDFFPYESSFRGGVFVGTGDVNGDDFADIITGTGVGGGARVVVFDGQTGEQIEDFFGFDPSVRTGVRVGSGDIDNDGFDDILVGAGPGAGPHAKAFSGKDGREIASFFADNKGHKGGVHVFGEDLDGDEVDDFGTEIKVGKNEVVKGFKANGKDIGGFETNVDD
jgi:hypothetical protein